MKEVNLGRILFLGCLWMILMMGLSARLVNLHLFEGPSLKEKGNALAERKLLLASFRGMILDRNGQPLAVSSPVKSIWADVTQVNLREKNWETLARLLGLSKAQLIGIVKRHPASTFLYLKRQMNPLLAQKILNLKLRGVYAQTEYRRFYPTGEVFSQVVGHTGVDHIGQEGVEWVCNTQLQGKTGVHRILKDRMGLPIESLEKQKVPTPGQDIRLSLDARLQTLAYRELLKACQHHQAQSGSIVILDVDTFEILAMANVPAYNPNDKISQEMRNRAVTDQFEPGSVMKPFSMVHILANSDYSPSTLVNTTPGWMRIENKIVKDGYNYGILDLKQVIQKSSNVGIAQLMLSLPPKQINQYYQLLEALGLGVTTGSGLPGERTGRILQEGKTHPFALATLAFGYGIALTPLQLAQSYAILASGGVKRPVSFTKIVTLRERDRLVLEDKTIAAIKLVNKMLVATSEPGGTAFKARIPGYSVAGKTGTVRKLVSHGSNYEYSDHKHMAIFAGFAPASHPKLAMAVIIDEPGVKYYGGEISAPIFSKVMGGALRILAVPRDDDIS